MNNDSKGTHFVDYLNTDIMDEILDLINQRDCKHNYEVKRKQPFYIFECSKCGAHIHSSKECYIWFKKHSKQMAKDLL